MADFSTGIPNIRVIVREATDENLLVDVPNISVKLEPGSQYNVNVTPNTVSTLRTGSFNTYADVAGLANTASYALVAQTLLGSVQSASYAYTASNILGGSKNYIPVWASDVSLSSSRIFQTQSSILIGATTQHTPEAPDTLGVFAESGSTSYNLISGHGNVNNYLQLNVKNFSSGVSSSSDIVATANSGTETEGYINLGINGDGYNVPNAIGGGLDGYLYIRGGNDLLIGNTAPDKNVIIFTGGENSVENGRLFIDFSGSVGINTQDFTTGAQEALLVKSINNVTYNLIGATGEVDNYIQFNIKNTSTGSSASSDIVATADNGNETTNFIDMGINGSNFAGAIGGPNDAYIYSTGNHLHIGNTTPGQDIMFFLGTDDVETGTKLTLRDTNIHDITGSLVFNDGGVTGSLFGTASWALNAITASYAVNAGAGAGFPFSGSAVITGSLLVSQSGVVVSGSLNVTQGITGSLLGTSSWANNSISSSVATTASAAASITFVPSTASFAITSSFSVTSSRAVTSSFTTTASYASNADLLDGLNSTVFATTGSNTFVGNQTITGSLITNADTLVFTGSMFTTGSMVVTGSINVFGSITGSLFGSSSFATTSSAATSITFTPTTASYALTSSYIDGGLY